MINSAPTNPTSSKAEEDSVDSIVQSGPRGAVAVAGIATAVVVALWFAFYLLVFLPRGNLQ
jgi:hypothetical protein